MVTVVTITTTVAIIYLPLRVIPRHMPLNNTSPKENGKDVLEEELVVLEELLEILLDELE